MFPRVLSVDGVRVVGRWNDMYLFGGFLLAGSNAEKCGDHWKKNFFINSSVGLSMCDGLIEPVKYICASVWIFDACLIGFSDKTAEFHLLYIQPVN